MPAEIGIVTLIPVSTSTILFELSLSVEVWLTQLALVMTLLG